MASPCVDVYVKLPGGRVSTLNLLPGAKVSKISDHVGSEEGIPGNLIRLKYQGKVLDKSKTVGNYGIRAETILKGEIVVPKTITVFVKFEDGRSTSYTLKNCDKVEDLKNRIYDAEEIPTTKQKLKFSGTDLSSNARALHEYGIGDESVLHISESTKVSTPVDASSSTGATQNPKEEISEELKDTVLSSFDSGGKRVEVVFCFDTTGSMSSYLTTVRTNLQDTCRRLLRDIPNIRIGIMAHGDYCDYNNYVVRFADLTSDVDELVDFAKNTPSTGGGDTPECYEWALRKAQHLDWSEDSAKALVVIGDCEPHAPSYTDQQIYWRTELDVLKGMGVKVYGVYCCRSSSNAEAFYEEISEETEGCMIKLSHFSLITDMFLGVCYREADPEQLDAFTEELKQEGKLTEDTKDLMEQLENKPKANDKTKQTKPKREINEGWWDPEKFDKSVCYQYTYNADTDSWSPKSYVKGLKAKDSEVPAARPVIHSDIKLKRQKANTKCTVM